MKKNRIYTKHQAFDTAHRLIKENSKNPEDGFNRPKKYHHAPRKLKDFTSYIGYFHWSNELYKFSTKLISLMREVYDRAEVAKSNWHDNKKNVNNILYIPLAWKNEDFAGCLSWFTDTMSQHKPVIIGQYFTGS